MHKRPTPFDMLTEPASLMRAWRRVRANRGAAGVDQVTLAEFERDLRTNLEALSARLREGRYYPMPVHTVQMRKAARKEAFKRLGRDGVLLLLTYANRARRLLSPAALALTGAAALGMVAYPAAARAVRRRLGGRAISRQSFSTAWAARHNLMLLVER
jgi:hypothetical protein